MFDSLNSLMPVVADAMETLAPIIEETVTVLAPLITELFDGLLPVLKSLLPMIVQIGGKFLTALLPPIMKLFNAVMPIVLQVLEALMPILDIVISLLGPILSLFTQLLAPVLDLISQAIAPLILVLAQLINAVLQPLGPIIEWLSGIFTDVLGNAINGIRPIIDALTGVFSGLIDFVKNVFAGNWEGAWDAIIKIFKNIWDGMIAIFKFPINWIIDGINLFLKGLNKLKIPDWVPAIGGKGIDIPLIPRLASGGFTDGMSIAGEAGMEAVISFLPQFRRENIDYWQEAGKMLGVLNSGSNGQPVAISMEGLPMFASGGFTNGMSIAGEAGKEAIISFDPSHRDENVGYWAAAGQLLGLPLQPTNRSRWKHRHQRPHGSPKAARARVLRLARTLADTKGGRKLCASNDLLTTPRGRATHSMRSLCLFITRRKWRATSSNTIRIMQTRSRSMPMCR